MNWRLAYEAGLSALVLALTFPAQMSLSRIQLQEPEIRAKLKKRSRATRGNPRRPDETEFRARFGSTL